MSANIDDAAAAAAKIDDTGDKSETMPICGQEARDAYFQALRVWLDQTRLAHNAAATFPYYLMANYPQLLASPAHFGIANHAAAIGRPLQNAAVAEEAPLRFGMIRMRQQELLDNPVRMAEIINTNGGYEYVIAPLWKRMVAELIDVILLFVVKLMAAFLIIDIFEMDLGLDFQAIRNSMDDDYVEFLALSSEMLYVEVFTKFFVCVYEALWTRAGFDQPGGATPGKICMGLRVLHVDAVVPLPTAADANTGAAAAAAGAAGVAGGVPGAGLLAAVQQHLRQPPLRALVYPAQDMGFQRAMVRALAKNVLMTLMFPLCFIMLFYRNNRTSYDVGTRTIVVETPRGGVRPPLRRL